MRHLLDALQHFEAAASALALQRIGGIGDELKFVQNELRNDESAVDELGFGNVRHTAVNDHAGIEKLAGVARAAFAAEDAAEGLQVEHVAFIGAEYEADVSHHEKRGERAERARALGHGGVRENQRGEIGAENLRIEPVAAPIKRRKLARRRRSSKRMTDMPKRKPMALPNCA